MKILYIREHVRNTDEDFNFFSIEYLHKILSTSPMGHFSSSYGKYLHQAPINDGVDSQNKILKEHKKNEKGFCEPRGIGESFPLNYKSK